MTIQELRNRVTVHGGSGQYKVNIEFRGKKYTCQSNNSLAYDAANYGVEDMTEKQGLQSFYDECKRKNNL